MAPAQSLAEADIRLVQSYKNTNNLLLRPNIANKSVFESTFSVPTNVVTVAMDFLWFPNRLEMPIIDLEMESRAIGAAYLRVCRDRPTGKKSISAMGANSHLRSSLYRLVLNCLTHDVMDELGDLARKRGSKLNDDEDPFRIGIRSIFSPREMKDLGGSPDRIWKQASYAHRHFIPAPMLEGFLLQCRADGMEGRFRQASIEPGFEEWVAGCLAIALARDIVTSLDYPVALMAEAEKKAQSIKDVESQAQSFPPSIRSVRSHGYDDWSDDDDDDDDGWDLSVAGN